MGTFSAPVSRRHLLAGGASPPAGAVAGATVTAAARGAPAPAPPLPADPGTAVEPFHGPHQAGVATSPQAHASFLAFDLHPGTDRAALGRLMRLLTDDAVRLTQGRPALADTEPELAVLPARLTVTFGFGPGLFRAAGLDGLRPPSVAPLPAYPIDRLEDRWSGGDLLIQLCADDPVTVAHAQRMLVKDTRAFGTPRWTQLGFRRGHGVEPAGRTQRNLLGQLDGTTNPAPGDAGFDRAVWATDGPDWFRGGTTVVIRRIRLELETWDLLGRADKEFAVGRRLDTGAPLTGTAEHDAPDFTATDPTGFTVIPEFSHVARAHVADEGTRMLRRPYNYDGQPDAAGQADSGMIFAAYQADVARQFLPVQQRLAESDLLNEWTTPIGSAVFAIPPGCDEGGWIGRQLLG
ncbi:Dyp-type peroxidase [Polymorphospora sp. A560]|uniref:Dyp-type peroxidase n=1 Tax=Polymorphospora sp. A560 TaxID=3040203 RepID=UPI003891269E